MIDRGKLEVRRVARVAIDDFEGAEVARIYLAARLAEAQLVEAELNKQDVDYAVEVESYLATAVFWLSEYRGAAFYAHAAQVDFCCGILRAAALTAGLLEKELQFP
ncbi:MAG TPA: hypothetical protein VNT76_06575 [Candidatus Binatus sp.]|nr:hypothetical protein [Candidatus Binatus sp.]